MAKPILLVRLYWRVGIDDFDMIERLTVKLQEQLNDYHVLGYPTSEHLVDGVEFKVLNVADISETLFFELKELILQHVRQDQKITGKADSGVQQGEG